MTKTTPTNSERLYVIETQLSNLIDEVRDLKKYLTDQKSKDEENYVRKAEFRFLSKVVYGSLSFIVTTIIGMLLFLLL
jgi:hypothetical protein